MKVLAAKTVEKCTVTLHHLLVILSTSAIQVLKTFYFLHEVFKQRTKLKAIFLLLKRCSTVQLCMSSQILPSTIYKLRQSEK